MKPVGVVRFPGTNCDRDVMRAAIVCQERVATESTGRAPVQWLWHQDRFAAKDFSGIYLPGGFSYGDYLRSGALAARAPVMASVREAAQLGIPVMGICNGFQILCEAGLLPGALVKNEGRRFRDLWVELSQVHSSPFFQVAKARIRLPIAHGDGRYHIGADGLKQLEDREQVWFRYESENPNGSVSRIAGVFNDRKNVCGLMPHPERAVEDWMGCKDGVGFFERRKVNTPEDTPENATDNFEMSGS